MRLPPACSVLLLLAATACQAPRPALSPAPPATLAITNVTVVDVRTGRLLPGRTIRIRGDEILSVAAEPARPGDARVVDGTGKFAIPGLWDMHAHVFMDEADADRYLPLYVAAGVTGIRDLGGSVRLARIAQIRADIAAGRRVGPAIRAAGLILNGPVPGWDTADVVRDTAMARARVRALRADGADFVKVHNALPRDLYFVVAAEARAAGLPLVGHVPFGVTTVEAAQAGQKSIEHLNEGRILAEASSEAGVLQEELRQIGELMLDPEGWQSVPPRIFGVHQRALASYDPTRAAALFAAHARAGVWHVPTLSAYTYFSSFSDSTFLRDPRLALMPAEIRAAWDPANNEFLRHLPPEIKAVFQASAARSTAFVGELHRAGIRLMTGTDFGNPYVFPGFSVHDEMALLVQAGLSPLDALRAATTNPAEFLGISPTAGAIDPGMRADLLLLDGNPLADIANVRRIHAVVAGGRAFTRADLDALLAQATSDAGGDEPDERR